MAKKRHFSRSGSGSNSRFIGMLVGGAVYGFIRQPIADALQNGNMSVLGDYTMPALGIGGGYLLSRQKGFIGDMGMGAAIVEAAGLAHNFKSGAMNQGSGAAGNTSFQ